MNTCGLSELWTEIEDKVESPWWVEPLKLLAGIYGEGNRTLVKLTDQLYSEHQKTPDPFAKKLVLLGDIAGEIPLRYSLLSQLASEMIRLLFDTKNYELFLDCKRILNHFYSNKTLWSHIVGQIERRGRSYRQSPGAFSGSAFHSYKGARKFGDSRIDRLLAIV